MFPPFLFYLPAAPASLPPPSLPLPPHTLLPNVEKELVESLYCFEKVIFYFSQQQHFIKIHEKIKKNLHKPYFSGEEVRDKLYQCQINFYIQGTVSRENYGVISFEVLLHRHNKRTCFLKGTVQQDFRPPVFFIIQTKIFSILLQISQSYSKFKFVKTDSPGYDSLGSQNKISS